jgi:hypothetical protein
VPQQQHLKLGVKMRLRFLDKNGTERELLAPSKRSKGSRSEYKIVVTETIEGEW